MDDQPLADYQRRVEAELAIYAERVVVHDLPPIYHYWSNRYALPRLAQVGIDSLSTFYTRAVVEACAAADRTVRVTSIGSGNGELEVELARAAADAGHHDVVIECVELNGTMLERTVELARASGVEALVRPVEADINTWRPDGSLDVAIASHSLHHVVELEHLFEALHAALAPVDGVLLVNDMIGRNGHMRWPEALALVERIWAVMPERYRYNHQLARHEERFFDWDCSTEGFEGIRAQDILPLLLDRFHAQVFVAFANVIDPFIDRSFGPNLDPENEADRAFIDAVAQLDDAALDLGVVSPTHLVASFRTRPVEARYVGPRSPPASIRRADAAPDSVPTVEDEGPPPVAIPVAGAIAGPGEGLDADGWVGRALRVEVRTLEAAAGLEVVGRAYHALGEPLTLELHVDGRPAGRVDGLAGAFQARFAVALPMETSAALQLRASAVRRPADVGESGDVRELAFRLEYLRLMPARSVAGRAREAARALLRRVRRP